MPGLGATVRDRVPTLKDGRDVFQREHGSARKSRIFTDVGDVDGVHWSARDLLGVVRDRDVLPERAIWRRILSWPCMRLLLADPSKAARPNAPKGDCAGRIPVDVEHRVVVPGSSLKTQFCGARKGCESESSSVDFRDRHKERLDIGIIESDTSGPETAGDERSGQREDGEEAMILSHGLWRLTSGISGERSESAACRG